ncbi:MAG: LptF/LptG family permease [Pirellulales bacterium]|nr:LptF/LptG family permease [Pirellulales bacterium]
MYIFTRYVVAEILKIFILTLTAITLLVTIGMGVKEGASRGCPPTVILHLMPYMLPYMLVITIPVSLLLAVSIVYGRMTGSNEIVALKSSGISPMDVIWPTIVLALLFSIGALYLQEFAATVGRPCMARVLIESIEDIALGMLKKDKYCSLPEFEITVTDVRMEDKMLLDPTIVINGRGNDQKIVIRAAKAKLETDRRAKTVNFKCWDYTIEYQGQGGVTISDPGMIERTVPIIDPGRDEFHRDWVAMHEIPDRLAQLWKIAGEIDEQRTALRERIKASPPQSEEKLKDIERLDASLKERHKDLSWKIHRLQTEPYRRLSNGFTCLCFALIGAPVAMLWRHTDVLTNFFVCFLPILAVYYPLLMIGEDLSTSGKFPPFSFWMGNVMLILPGIFLLKWVVRH